MSKRIPEMDGGWVKTEAKPGWVNLLADDIMSKDDGWALMIQLKPVAARDLGRALIKAADEASPRAVQRKAKR